MSQANPETIAREVAKLAKGTHTNESLFYPHRFTSAFAPFAALREQLRPGDIRTQSRKDREGTAYKQILSSTRIVSSPLSASTTARVDCAASKASQLWLRPSMALDKRHRRHWMRALRHVAISPLGQLPGNAPAAAGSVSSERSFKNFFNFSSALARGFHGRFAIAADRSSKRTRATPDRLTVSTRRRWHWPTLRLADGAGLAC